MLCISGTPTDLRQAGRDHWGRVFSIALAGAGLRGGQVDGASDAHGGEPSDRPVSPGDYTATIFHSLGVNPASMIRDPLNRPHHLTTGQPLECLWG